MDSIMRLACNAVLFSVALAAAPSASAAGGWYLLIPPTSDYNESAEYLQGYKILDSKPLSQWSQQGAYDTTSECEASRNSLLMADHNFYSKTSADYINALGAKKDPAVLKMMRWTTERSNANVNAWTASRCIKSDDPRLSK